jgi:hypothetical protein
MLSLGWYHSIPGSCHILACPRTVVNGLFEFLVCQDGFQSFLNHSIVQSNPKWGLWRQSQRLDWVVGAKYISFQGSLVLVGAVNSLQTFAVLSVWDVWSHGIAFLVLDIQISGVMWPQCTEHVYSPHLDCNQVQCLGSLFRIPAATPSVL